MSYIYHYCTVESLKEILKNRTLRLSDIRKSNDSKEIDYLFDSYCEYIKKSGDYSPNTMVRTNFLNREKTNQLKNTVFLVSCFSKKDDDLHMWSCYGNKGVCLEFDREELQKHINKIRHGVSSEILSVYPNLKVTSLALQLVDVKYYSQSELEKCFEKNKYDFNEEFYELFKNSPTIKSDFFECEEEVRIIYYHIFDGTPNDINFLVLTDDDGNINKRIYFKSTSDSKYQHKLVADIPIPMSLISSITIGPNSSITNQDLEEIFFANGIEKYTIAINKSKGSYR